MLFNAYSNNLFKKAFITITNGVLINGELINNMRYADADDRKRYLVLFVKISTQELILLERETLTSE